MTLRVNDLQSDSNLDSSLAMFELKIHYILSDDNLRELFCTVALDISSLFLINIRFWNDGYRIFQSDSPTARKSELV